MITTSLRPYISANKLFPVTTMAEQPQGNPIVHHLGFDDLPNELKLHILRYALALGEETIHAYDYHYLEAEACLNVIGLFLTNKAMHDIASEVYYSSNTFVIERSFDTRPGYGAGQFTFRYPSFKFGHFVRKLELRLAIWTLGITSTDELLQPERSKRKGHGKYLASYDLATLMHRRLGPAYHNADWQAYFPRLDLLSLKLSEASCLDSATNASIRGLPEHAAIAISPKRVNVKVEPIACSGILCGGNCEEIIRGTIRSMVQLRADA